MKNSENLCMSCMKDTGGKNECPHCGYAAGTPQAAPNLPVKTVLARRYLVGKAFDANGEGVTYMALDLITRTPVHLREFFPDTLVTRREKSLDVSVSADKESSFSPLLRSFLELWRRLAKMRSVVQTPNVLNIFEENGTAYVVTEHFESVTLRDFLLRTPTGFLNWDQVRQLFMPLLSALEQLHQAGIVHLGLSPTTLLIDKSGKLRITGFCITQARIAGSPINPQFFNGYAAIEQYSDKLRCGVWTDIYAFTALIYRALIGTDPIDAPTRSQNDRLMIPGKFAEQIPAYVINAMINALQILPENRTAVIGKLRDELAASPSAVVTADRLTPREKRKLPKDENVKILATKGDRILAAKAALITFVVGLLIFIVLITTVFRNSFFGSKPVIEEDETTTSVTQEVEVPDFKKIGTYPEVFSSALWNTRFKFEAEEVYDDKAAVGTILSQSVAPGTMVETGTLIKFKVSKGREMILLPPAVIGMEYEAAKELLTKLGFVPQRSDEPNDGTKAPNTVFATSPLQNQEHPRGTKVVLKVWSEIETAEQQESTQP